MIDLATASRLLLERLLLERLLLDGPFLGAARSALTKISSSKPPTVTELKTTWSAVSLQDFPYNISAKQLEKVLHQKLQHRLRGQKLWIGNGMGGGNPTSTNVSMCYGPMTGLVRNPRCNNVS